MLDPKRERECVCVLCVVCVCVCVCVYVCVCVRARARKFTLNSKYKASKSGLIGQVLNHCYLKWHRNNFQLEYGCCVCF